MRYFFHIIFFLFISVSKNVIAQNPVAFQITSEEGLPNQTVYSILQDKKGFIWLGTDAGLFKYDGIRYYEYKNPSQSSRSLTGLIISSDGKIYAHNFNGQIFYTENDSLKLLNSWNKGAVTNICADKNNNLWVSYDEGIEMYSTKTKKWISYSTNPNDSHREFTHSCFIDKNNSFWCVGPDGLIQINNGKETFYNLDWKKGKVSGEYQLAFYSNNKFIFSRVDGEIFYLVNGSMKPFYSKNLNPLLKDKKITRIQEDDKGYLWIYTFSGVIIYDIKNDKSELFYETTSFSCGINDNENSYWLATLHDGFLRIPELSYKLWEVKDDKTISAKINKIVCANSSAFFATVNGKIGELNFKNNFMNLVSLDTKLDIQSLAFTENKQSVLFSIQNSIFTLGQNKTKSISKNLPPAKDILQIGDHYVVATSKGTFWYSINQSLTPDILTPLWSRSIAYNKITNQLWIATNDGIKAYAYHNNKWNYLKTILKGIQTISLCYTLGTNKLYALTFNGNIYEILNTSSPVLLTSLNQSITGYQIKANSQCIYSATNKGLWMYDLKSNQTQLINKLSGLVSNNVNGIDIDSNYIWLATSKGIEQIPINPKLKKTSSKIYLKKIIIENQEISNDQIIKLNYNQGFKIELDAIALSSENKFEYAYRLNNNSSWIFLPADINQIEIPSLNTGIFNLEIKLVDHLGKDSVNSILINGYVSPPFWQRWWFYLLIGITCLTITFIGFKQRIKLIHKKQVKELEKLQLKHELKLSQETALRAQMNPHFIFNVLNSIKSYIYENDKKKAVNYLQRFSDLVRKILEQSSSSWVKLDEEINLLKLYIELEAMLFIDEFEYTIRIDENIDTEQTNIPTLILQPYIENAFKHGLRHKSGKKELLVDFKLISEVNVLAVTITDNGVGRSQSTNINQTNSKKHQSFSTQAINRVLVLNQNQPGIVSVVYNDLYDTYHNSNGTSVEIKIQLND